MIIPSLGGKTSPETSQPQRLRRGQEKRTFLGPKSEKKNTGKHKERHKKRGAAENTKKIIWKYDANEILWAMRRFIFTLFSSFPVPLFFALLQSWCPNNGKLTEINLWRCSPKIHPKTTHSPTKQRQNSWKGGPAERNITESSVWLGLKFVFVFGPVFLAHSFASSGAIYL